MKALLLKAYHKLRFALLSRRRREIRVMSAGETTEALTERRCSAARFGDGELNMILRAVHGYDSSLESGFQSFDNSLGLRLKEVLESVSSQTDCLVCLPGCLFAGGTSYLRSKAAAYWESYAAGKLDKVLPLLDRSYRYGDSLFTRFYLSHRDKSRCREHLEGMQAIWSGRNILIVEGEKTRLGAGNDLFCGASDVKRILCPPTDAWGQYDRILSAVKEAVPPTADDPAQTLVLCALGMTATVLAYDLSQAGYQAIDLGHIDIEYEWMRMGATDKVPVPGKYTNEAYGEVSDSIPGMDSYRREIIRTIS